MASEIVLNGVEADSCDSRLTRYIAPDPRRSSAPRTAAAAGKVLESGVLLQKRQAHRSSGAVALFADDELGHAFDVGIALALLPVHFFAEDEEHDIGVLLERARLAQVRELRPVIAAGFWRAAELAEREDRHPELLGENLQRPGNRRQFLLPVLEPPAPLHELEVVDDQHVESVLELEPPRLGTHLEDADRRRVVDEHFRVVEPAEGVDQPGVVLLAEKPAAEAVRVDPRFRRQHAQEQLLFRHFQAEHAHRLPGLDAAVERHVQHEAGLPHRRARGDDHQVGFLESRRHLVEIDEAARHAGDQPLVLLELLDHRVAGIDELAELDEAGAQPVLGDLEDRPLGFVEQGVGVLLGLVRTRQDVGGRLDQPPHRRFFLDDLGVVLDVGRARHAVGEGADVGRPADFFNLVRSRQLVLDGDEIHRLAAVGERHHLLEDAAVRIAEEVLGVDDLGGLVEDLVVDENRAEHALLGLEVVRQGAIHGCNDTRQVES